MVQVGTIGGCKRTNDGIRLAGEHAEVTTVPGNTMDDEHGSGCGVTCDADGAETAG
jgi:hypothetical protein